MGREWKPGDVALVRNDYDVWNVAIFSVDAEVGTAWRFGVADAWMPPTAAARPLAVIDPEDPADLDRLARGWEQATHATLDCDLPLTMQQLRAREGLRAFIAPPRPPEPTGLGAVVEDAEGVRYVRAPERDGVVWRGSGTWVYKDWVSIDAVKVLSEGVTG